MPLGNWWNDVLKRELARHQDSEPLRYGNPPDQLNADRQSQPKEGFAYVGESLEQALENEKLWQE